MDEQRLRSVLKAAVAAQEPPVRGGPAGVFVWAEVMRRRRRLGNVAIAVGVVAVMVLSMILLGQVTITS